MIISLIVILLEKKYDDIIILAVSATPTQKIVLLNDFPIE